METSNGQGVGPGPKGPTIGAVIGALAALAGVSKDEALQVLAPALTDVLFIHKGELVAVCPLSRSAEKKLSDLIANDTTGTMPPSMALVTTASRATKTLQILLGAGLNIEVEADNEGDLKELKHVAQTHFAEKFGPGYQGTSAYVTPDKGAQHVRPQGAPPLDPRNN